MRDGKNRLSFFLSKVKKSQIKRLSLNIFTYICIFEVIEC